MNSVDSLTSNRFRVIPRRSSRIDDLGRAILHAKSEGGANVRTCDLASSDVSQISETVSFVVVRGGLNQASFEFDTCVD